MGYSEGRRYARNTAYARAGEVYRAIARLYNSKKKNICAIAFFRWPPDTPETVVAYQNDFSGDPVSYWTHYVVKSHSACFLAIGFPGRCGGQYTLDDW